MCKVGIILMAADLYISDYELFLSLVSIFFHVTKTAGGDDDGVDAIWAPCSTFPRTSWRSRPWS